ncbi:MAG TPA: thioredoxin family protein [Acidobacteriaceae bacterium]|jgi:thiol:disulfide interchange protein|nr:thioredoxin family protein [Acidobacteriaceae bacterium]
MPAIHKISRFSLLAILSALLFSAAILHSYAAEKIIYPEPDQAKADLAAGLKAAAASHKHIIIDFGGNWCGDCQVLDIYFHDPGNKPLLDANYVLIHVNIGHMTENLSIAQRYQVPLEKGVPALAVLDEHGRLLYSQRTGEFESMRRMESSAVTSFLLQWKPAKPGM